MVEVVVVVVVEVVVVFSISLQMRNASYVAPIGLRKMVPLLLLVGSPIYLYGKMCPCFPIAYCVTRILSSWIFFLLTSVCTYERDGYVFFLCDLVVVDLKIGSLNGFLLYRRHTGDRGRREKFFSLLVFIME